MKQRLKTWIFCVCILLVSVLILSFVQALVVPKYMTSSLEGNLTAEYYGETTNHDVLFIGDCEIYECFTPPTLWQEYGITSYVRGGAQHLAWHSYYLLEDTLRYETPKVVVYNVLAFKYGEPQSEAYNRMALDGMKWSSSKIEAIRASMTEDETFLSYVFPILRFHSRWSKLEAEDFRYIFGRDTVSHNGYLMQTGIDPMTHTFDPLPLRNPQLPETSMEYLERMRALCEEKGIELVLVKAPTNTWKYYWYEEWDAQICDYAEKNGLDYYNFIPQCEEIGIDWSTDTYDRGAHLNVYGAEKLTSYFGKILAEKYGVEDRREQADLVTVWNQKLVAYEAQKKLGKDD